MKRLTGLSALALAASAGWAQADVTPQQVWDSLESYMQGFGYDVAGTQSMSGDTLTVRDAAFSVAMPEEDGSVTFRMDEVVLTDRGDGTVSVAFPAIMPIRVTADDGDDAVDVTVNYTHENLEMIVSGTPEAMVWDYTADQLGFALVEPAGAAATQEVVRFAATMGPVEGRSEVTTDGDVQTILQTMALGDLNYDFAAQDPDGEGGGTFTGTMSNLSLEGESRIPGSVDLQDMEAAIEAGFAGGGRFAHEGGRLSFLVTDEGDVTTGELTSGSGHFEVDVSAEGLLYKTGGTDTQIAMTVPDFPFPINAQWAESGFGLLMPLQPSQDPQPASLEINLTDFSMADDLWALFDPAAILPRDPATIVIDLAAQLTPFVSLFDAEAMEELESSGAVPGELNTLTLEGLTLDMAGASVTGTGAFTFDNSDLETLGGFPRPAGKVELALSGHNGLIDNLIQMGVLAQEDAMGARMMLGMFTVPTGSPDSATSTIEINDQFHILANGQRIQ